MTFRVEKPSLPDQARDSIIRYIKTMDLGASRRLPGEEELCELLGVSRITVRTALNELASQGLVTRRQGRGTFVNAAALNIKVPFNPVSELTAIIHQSGFSPSVRVSSIRLVRDAKVEASLRVEGELARVEKVFAASGRFCACCIDYFPVDLIGGPDALSELADAQISVFPFLYRHSGRRVARDHVTIAAMTAAELAEVTALDPTTLGSGAYLAIEGVNYDADDRPLMLSSEYIDTKLLQFEMVRRRTIHYP